MTGSFEGTTTQKAGKVLTVNSDHEVTHILEVNLTHANLEVISAQSGAEGLRKACTEKPDIILLDPALPDIDGIEICRQLKRSPKTSHIPVIFIGAKTPRKNRTVKDMEGADHYINKPFDPKEVVALVRGYLTRKERMKNLNPLTGLSNQIQVSNELSRLIERKKIFAAIYISMDDLRSFNKVYGFAHGDRTIRLLADILCEAVRLSGNPEDLVGHIDGDKFVVISTPLKSRSLCRRIIADFNRRVKTLYTDEHLKKGYIAYDNPLGGEEQKPIMSLRAAVVTNEKHTFHHHLEVSEAAAEQMDCLRHFPGGKSYFDLQASGLEPGVSVTPGGIPHEQREELKAVHGALAWLDFVIRELNIPIIVIKDCLDAVEYMPVENFSPEQRKSLKIIRENVNRLVRVVEGLDHLTSDEWLTASAVFEEIDISQIFNRIMEQVQELVEQRRIEVDIEGVDNIAQLITDRRNLTQGLLYIVRSEIQSGPSGSRLRIHAAEMNEEFISIQITNPGHHIPQRTLATLLQGQPEGKLPEALRNELYPAKLLVQGLGGKLNIASAKEKGITYTIVIPRKWQSWLHEVNALRLAIDVSRKEARAELKNIHLLLSSLLEQVPQAMKDSLEILSGKVQELGILCNRSLFLIEDLSSQLEIHQDRLQQQGVEQLTTTEAMLAIGREIARSMHVENVFDPDSAKRVARYALTIANEFTLSASDRQALHHAALLKDLGLALSPHDMVEQMVVPTIEEATAVRARFNLVWKVLSTIPFLSLALVFILYRYERYDGTGGPFGVSGDNIPLGARILAVADTFDSMTSSLSPREALAPGQAVQKIVDGSGQRSDPDVVNAFLRAWKKKELYPSSSES